MTDRSIPEWAATGDFLDDLDPEDGFDSPEEGAFGDIPEQFVTLLGVQIEGDYARVWTLLNDRPTFEGYEDFLVRKGRSGTRRTGPAGSALTPPARSLRRLRSSDIPARPGTNSAARAPGPTTNAAPGGAAS